MSTKLTPDLISAAITGYELQVSRIQAKIAELRTMLPGGSAEAAAGAAPGRKPRRFSAATRRRMREAQQRRRAAAKKQSEPSAPSETPKPKHKLSAAGRKAIIEATKKRWALKHAEAARAAAKKAAPRRKAAPTKAAKKSTPRKKSAAKTTVPAVAAAGQADAQ